MKAETLAAIESARSEKRPLARAVRLDGEGEEVLDGTGEGPLEAEARTALRLDAARVVETDGGRWFVQPFNPPLRLVLVGAVHISQPLERMATLAGYAVTIVDPREAFAQAARFPGVHVVDEWPDDALEVMALDARCAVVTLTHDPKLDDPALTVALNSPAFYIGCLGSKKTHAARVGRLEKKGFTAAQIGRLRAPVGLPIGAKSPAEIAVATLAQITEVLRKGDDA